MLKMTTKVKIIDGKLIELDMDSRVIEGKVYIEDADYDIFEDAGQSFGGYEVDGADLLLDMEEYKKKYEAHKRLLEEVGVINSEEQPVQEE